MDQPSRRDREELELVERARQGDRGAFAALVERYWQALARYLVHLTGDPETALDLTQDTFVRAYRSIRSTRPGLAVRAWLYRIATNLAYDHLRRRRIAWLPLRQAERQTVASGVDVEERELVGQALARLSEIDRAVLLLCGVEQRPYLEVAAILGTSPEAARKQFARAKARFRVVYAELSEKGSD